MPKTKRQADLSKPSPALPDGAAQLARTIAGECEGIGASDHLQVRALDPLKRSSRDAADVIPEGLDMPLEVTANPRADKDAWPNPSCHLPHVLRTDTSISHESDKLSRTIFQREFSKIMFKRAVDDAMQRSFLSTTPYVRDTPRIDTHTPTGGQLPAALCLHTAQDAGKLRDLSSGAPLLLQRFVRETAQSIIDENNRPNAVDDVGRELGCAE